MILDIFIKHNKFLVNINKNHIPWFKAEKSASPPMDDSIYRQRKRGIFHIMFWYLPLTSRPKI